MILTEAEKRMHRCGITGHRPHKISRDLNEVEKDIIKVITELINEGFYTFVSGMAPGTDIIFAESVLKLKEQYPRIHLICAIPFPGFENQWKDEWKDRYRNVLRKADITKFISEKYSFNCFQKRNAWIVDHTARMIAVYNGSPGGTQNTIQYSLKQGVKIEYIKG